VSAVPPENREPGRTRRLQYQFTAHMRDPDQHPAPEGIEDRRIGIYRELIFCNAESFVSSNFPVIRTLYNEAEWNALVRGFLREHLCHTPLFPEFSREFMRYVEWRQQQDKGDPPFLLELAHYEWAELALNLDENDIAAVPHDPNGDAIDGVPAMSPLACVLPYRFPVHLIGQDFIPTEAPAEPTVLLLVRGRDDHVHFHEINTLGALLIERLQQNESLTGNQCLEQLLADHGVAGNAEMRAAGIAMLRDLQTNEAILGTRTA